MNLLKALAAVSSMTLLSRILGFARDTIIARVFGAGAMTDAFFVAFKIPNLLRRLFAEGAFSQAFVPILGEYRNRRGVDATRLLVGQVGSALTLVLIVVTALGMAAAPWIAYVSAPGFVADAEKFDLTVELLRITFPYILFISLVALAAGILNTWSRFSVPAFAPVLLNVAMIGAALWLAPHCDPPVLALAWGVMLGGVLQLAWMLPHLARIRMLPRPTLRFDDPGLARILKLMAPAVLGVSVAQISLLINTVFASFLATGSVSWLYYADRLMEFPTGLLGVALGTILLPSLARHYADNSPAEYSRLLDWGLRLTVLLALPAAAALAVLAVPLIATLFHYGAFTAHDVTMTQQALIAYSLGLLGLILVKVLAPGFYARQNVRTPVKIAIFTLFATQLMNLVFIFPLGHAGLALAIGLGACLNASLLLHLLKKHGIYQPQPGWAGYAARIVFAVGLMAALLFFAMGEAQWWLDAGFADRLMRLAMLMGGGVATYFTALALMGFRPRQFARRAAE
ncbi:MAG: murein biosynthesis integral membrane protein MurJ [Hydrogenophilales bacterium 16-64-46]|nr:MAG: murein biosynthesis integral membrane protein MurJ [Hydrogenophilales bacterium 12-64-13]OYZ04774.1 MAG: murein biosynthesis integral membrane protein MurJ [Hydrogenophilales bacterium 16-64-46]OZA38460.1 MAG: murein biosynthesis integral membrane protein MurJ [Hydrogenophilales bacterium 17-64-34]HQT00109.1 murein biosynthesis integral membrane protein MurJ [Thiobacillus sp.]